ncbi:MAG: sensor histidine kinase [Caldilineaceae bacterium]|nr:sensor histidine kinase [Caldilineaceae bacterium]
MSEPIASHPSTLPFATGATEETHADSALSPSQRMLTVTEEELSRIILDIHDGPVQYLFTALSLLTGIQQEVSGDSTRPDLPPRLAQVGMLLESSLYEIKFFMGAFRPPEFRRRSLVSIVEGLVIQHEEWTGNTVELTTGDLPAQIALPVKIALYRIVQEALSNSYRHAGVEEVHVGLWHDDGKLCLEVYDEGQGFDPATLSPHLEGDHVEHLGLRGMRDRVAILGGHFELDSRPGRGTRIYVELPA